jgi:hypothetical protein
MGRNSGFYWVKLGGWVIGHYNNYSQIWVLAGNTRHFLDSTFDEIDENQITRNNG